MKKIILLQVVLLSGLICFAQSIIPVSLNGGKNTTEIIKNSNSTLKFTSELSKISFTQTIENDEIYSKILIDGYITNNKVGFPQLPVMVKMIEVPMGAEISSKVTVNSEKIVKLSDYDCNYEIVPCQPSLFKNQKKEDIPFAKDKIYSEGGLYSPETIVIEEAGIIRGIRLVKIIINPFVYDISDNTLTVRENVSVSLSFDNADTRSNSIKNSKYSPAFAGIYDKIWNYKQTRDAAMQYPIKYVIISDRMFEETLQPFIEWKTKKGFNVITAYTDEIGRTDANIKTYLQGLYEAGTSEDPAPSYVLYVGDTAQISVTYSKLPHSGGIWGDENDHYSDVYKVCFDGNNDYIPDMYYGRFSAQNVSQLLPQIEKTLMFEQYTFADDSYLSKTVLVAGYDGSIQYDDINGNGQINYLTRYYANDEIDVNNSVYLSPESHNSASAIKSKISEGVGFVNYSAHCDQNGWQDPSFTRTDVANLQNDGKYFFSIGNCCLSNKFDVAECFGETLLRSSGKGAVCHIGGTNSSIWDEDFYWSVGVMSPISANPTYEATTQAAYDHLFHKNGETPNVSAGEIIFAGNFSVNSSTSTYIQYYWEIYTLMGDPSLMPYVGLPTELVADYTNIIPIGTTNLTVATEDITYVALSQNGVLLDAKYTGNGNSAELNFDAITETGDLDIVITRQFRQPHISTITVSAGTNQNDIAIQSIVAPSTAMSVGETAFVPEISIINLGVTELTSATASYKINNGTPININWTGHLAQYETANITFDEISLEIGNYAFEFSVSQPNGQPDEDMSNNTKTRDVLVSSGNVSIVSVSEPNGEYCGYRQSEPTIIIRNASPFAITSLVASYTCGELSAEKTFEVNIASGASASLTFDPVIIPVGEGSISFVVTTVNGGENENQTPKVSEFNILSHEGEGFRLSLMADYYGNQTTWDIKDESGNIIYSGNAGSYTGTIVETDFCLGEGCYTFNLYDSGNNGLIGYYGILYQGSATFVNLNTNETLLSDNGSEEFSTKTIDFCVEGNTTETEIQNVSEISIFPNPTSGMLNIATENKIGKVEIINGLGEIVISRKISDNNANIDMSNLSNGMYFVRISGNNNVQIMKVILEK